MANYGLKAMYTGVSNIMDAFDSLRGNNPFYSVWYGNNMLFQYSNNDVAAGRLQLEQMLTAMEQSGNADIITIKFHPKVKGGYITNKSESTGMIPVRVVELDNAGLGSIEPSSTGLLPAPVYNMFQRLEGHLNKSNEEKDALIARIGALELAAVVPEVPVKTWIDQVKDVMEIPGISDIAIKLITPLLGLAGIGQAGQPNLMINGMNEQATETKPVVNEQPASEAPAAAETETALHDLTEAEAAVIDTAIADLSGYCDIITVLPKLAKFAAEQTQTFNFLLEQLK